MSLYASNFSHSTYYFNYSNFFSSLFLPKIESSIQNPINNPMMVKTIINLSNNCSKDKPGL